MFYVLFDKILLMRDVKIPSKKQLNIGNEKCQIVAFIHRDRTAQVFCFKYVYLMSL